MTPEQMLDTMTPEQMLEQLNREGGDAGADYNDSEDVDGYFDWKVEDGVITVHHVAADNLSHTDTHAWRLVPVETDLFRDARLVLLPYALSVDAATEYIRRSLNADTAANNMWTRDTVAFLVQRVDQLASRMPPTPDAPESATDEFDDESTRSEAEHSDGGA